MRTGLTIGEFATLSHLSVRTLRRYHESGLLEPAAVDPFTGYRCYSAEQIPPAQVIRRLRQLLHPGAADLHVELRSVPARPVAAISSHVRQDEVHPWYDDAMAELDAA